MTKKKDQPFNNPFGNLKLEQKPQPAKAAPPAPQPKRQEKPKALDAEAAHFLEAVGEVAPVRTTKARVEPPPPPSAAQLRAPSEEAESMARLAELVSADGEFDIADESDFLEAAVHGFDERVMRKLRAGEFEAQARLDLHGLTRDEAKPALEAFVQRARLAGHRCVLVVTGKGINSADGIPVLKQGAQQWLTRGRTGKQVLALASARPKDGGTGALYVLLRR